MMTLTFSHNLQFFPEALAGLTPFAMCYRAWISCYLNTHFTCHLELDSHQSNIFSLHLQRLRPQLLNLNPHSWMHINPHSWTHIQLPLHCSANLLFPLLSYECFHLQSMNLYTKTPVLVLHASLPSCLNLLCNNSAFLVSKQCEGENFHLAISI